MDQKYYITTAIDYANGAPHLGHAYEKILADTIARYKRMRGYDVYFLTGLDEHGQKVQQSAQKQGIEPIELCDKMALIFQDVCKELSISNDDYIRTTQSRHKALVNQVLSDLFKKGDIYKADYKGFYSTRQEQFLQEKDRDETGNWPEIFGEVVELTESNYFFKLSQYQDWLIQYIQNNPDFIFPKFRAKQVLEFLKEPLNDLCISRPIERLSWGIPLPFDDQYVTYVWFDALLNYAIVLNSPELAKYWPADLHVIGKDILCPPHAVYWPIMLKAANIEIPKQFLAHGWWMVNNSKMSKSTGNVIDPFEVAKQYGTDPFRYFLMREMTIGQDANFSLELFNNRYNSELANDLGNLVSRLQNMVSRYTQNKVPSIKISQDPEIELQALWAQTSVKLLELADEFAFHLYIDHISQFIRAINRYVDIRSPWKLAKSEDPSDREILETSLAIIAEALRLANIALAPIMPNISEKISSFLNTPQASSFKDVFTWGNTLEGHELGEKVILFPKINQPELCNS